MNTVDIIDYVPLFLSWKKPELVAVYATLKHFANKRGQIDITLKQVQEHLDIEEGHFDILIEDLIELSLLTKQENGYVVAMAPSRRERRGKLADYAFGNDLPNGYDVLLDDKQMYKCFVTNGNVLWKVLAEVARFFNLDYNVLRRLMDNPNFRDKFMYVRQRAEEAAAVSGAHVTKRKLKKQSDKTITELTKQLIDEVHIKNGNEIPIHDWKSPQLLRYYCISYEKRYSSAFIFAKNPFGSFEMIQMKAIQDAFDGSAEEAVKFIDWCIDVKSHEPTIRLPMSPKFMSLDNVIREYKQKGTQIEKHIKKPDAAKVSKSALLPTTFIEWIVQKYPAVQDTFRLSKMEELVWMKKLSDENDLPHPDLKFVIEEAIKTGLIT